MLLCSAVLPPASLQGGSGVARLAKGASVTLDISRWPLQTGDCGDADSSSAKVQQRVSTQTHGGRRVFTRTEPVPLSTLPSARTNEEKLVGGFFFSLFQAVNVGFNHYLWMGTAIMFIAAANSSVPVTGPFCINGAIWLMTSASDIYVKCRMANKNYNFTSVRLMDFNLLPGVGTV